MSESLHVCYQDIEEIYVIVLSAEVIHPSKTMFVGRHSEC